MHPGIVSFARRRDEPHGTSPDERITASSASSAASSSEDAVVAPPTSSRSALLHAERDASEVNPTVKVRPAQNVPVRVFNLPRDMKLTIHQGRLLARTHASTCLFAYSTEGLNETKNTR